MTDNMAARNQCDNASFTDDEAYTCNRVQEMTFLISYALVGVVMFFGNSFVCLVFLASKKLRRNFMNIFLLSLSVSDMLMALLIVPFYTVHCFRDCSHVLTPYCWLLRKARDFALTATMLNTCAISYDRYLAILRPLQYGVKMTRLRVGAILTFVWLIPVVVAVTRNFWHHSAQGEERRHLTVKLYDVAVVIVPVILFQTVILAVNIQIIRKIHQHKKATRKTDVTSCPSELTRDLKEISRLIKGTTSCVLVVLTFVISWLPKAVHNFSYVFDSPNSVLSSPLFFRICFLFLFIQSCFNPFIYTVYRAQFRKTARSVISKWCC